MRAVEVRGQGNGFRLGLVPGACDGAEVRTIARHQFGRYTMRMKTPTAPGSISAFFLYADVRGGNDEIDIEILNDTSRTALLTTWIAGEKTYELKLRLGFDPARNYHDYEIDWSRSTVAFRADGGRLAVLHKRVPTTPMKVMANIWWPTWTQCAPLSSSLALEIESYILDDR